MAIAYCLSSPNHIFVQNSGPTMKLRSKTMMLKHSQLPFKKTAAGLQVRSSFKNKVFENQSEGIICYRDESGEIICEGFDEGPRFHQQLPTTVYNSRDAEIISLLQQRSIQVVHGSEFNNTHTGVTAIQEDFDFKWSGFNKFC